uniref:Uncharacterized protein n=1 Tax=Rhizophora mucronata TaxID=61149 RepID=A0A2P2NML1_RHIMU
MQSGDQNDNLVMMCLKNLCFPLNMSKHYMLSMRNTIDISIWL